ncbi:hypothetical protein BHE74_00019955, partial [Ensete ventricosum]
LLSDSRLHDVVHSEKSIYLVFEYMDMDLKKHMDSHPEFFKDRRLIKVRIWQQWCPRLNQQELIFSRSICYVYFLYANSLFDAQKMLHWEPGKRIHAREALQHEYLKDLGVVP